MTDERAALVAAIAENPDDDTARLVFADWLDEHGEPDRAEFVRLQCEAVWGEPPWPFRRAAPRTREERDRRARELFEAGWRRWFDPFFAPLAGPAWADRFKPLFIAYSASSEASEHVLIADLKADDSRTADSPPVSQLFVTRGFGDWLLVNRPDRLPAGGLDEAFRHEPVADLRLALARPSEWGRVTGPALRRVRRLGIKLVHHPGDPIAPVDAGVRALAAALDPARVREFAVQTYGLSRELVGELRERFGTRLVAD